MPYGLNVAMWSLTGDTLILMEMCGHLDGPDVPEKSPGVCDGDVKRQGLRLVPQSAPSETQA